MPEQRSSERKTRELSSRQWLFAQYYVELGMHGHGTQAAIRAGYAPKSADVRASMLLKNPRVLADIDKVRVSMRELMGITADRTAQEIARCGYFDPRRAFDAEGRPKPIHELDADIAAAIASVEVSEVEGVRHYRYRFVAKTAALDMAARTLGMFAKDNAQRVRTIDDYSDAELLAIVESERAIRRAQVTARHADTQADS